MNEDVSLIAIIKFYRPGIKEVYGDPYNVFVRYLRDPENVDEYTLDWINPKRSGKQKLAEETKAKAIFVDSEVVFSEIIRSEGKVLIVVENPRLAVAKVGNEFFMRKLSPGIHPSSVIHPEAVIGSNVYIGPFVVLGRCEIGDNVAIHSNVNVYDNVKIRNNTLIHSGSVIGIDGFGCERDKDKRLVKFPHSGGLIIGEDVEIGAGCKIAKGALSSTIIGDGTKINAGSYIGHNVFIGENVWISPNVIVTGSVKIFNNVTIFTGAIIREQRTIGPGATVGMGSIVTKDVPGDETWIGNPAKKLNV